MAAFAYLFMFKSKIIEKVNHIDKIIFILVNDKKLI